MSVEGKKKATAWMTKAATAQLFVQERHFSRALKEELLGCKQRGAAASGASQLLFTGRVSDRCSYYSLITVSILA